MVAGNNHSIAVFYPVFLNLRNIPVLLVGGGEIAWRKADSLMSSGCSLTVIAPSVIPEFEPFLSRKNFRWEARVYRPGEAKDYVLILAATDDADTNQQVYDDARASERLINVADRPDLCSFTVPSTLHRGPLQIAISTAGKCPALARHLRTQLEEELPDRYGTLLEELAIIRGYIKEKIKSRNYRKIFISRIVASRASKAFLEGNGILLANILKGWKCAKPRKVIR